MDFLGMRSKSRGFTLVELMLVVTIIAIISALAIPKYLRYQCKAKQIEARQGLGSMAKMQAAHYAEYSEYSMDLEEIGFSMKSGIDGHYEYEILSASDVEWEAQANGKAESFRNRTETWTINQSLVLTNVENGCY